MRYSKLFGKTIKEFPKDETSLNGQLLIKAGYVYKEMAGVYAYLPLGIRILENIKKIIREEMNKIGGQEIIMASLQKKELWEQTDRWDDKKVDVWFKSKLLNGTEVGFGWSHEEPITEMMKHYVASYKDLPVYVYQFQTKLRNELRAKSGILRGREFVMKDMYSYSRSEKQHNDFYNQAIEAYLRIFERMGLKKDTFVTLASGGAFTEFSHEFQTITEAGEDIIYINRKKNIAINKEVLNERTLKELGVSRMDLEEVKASEIGNIFYFGTVKSKQLGLDFANKNGGSELVHLGSYGIGITRSMGILVEKLADDKGLVWPDEIAPYQVHLIGLQLNNETVKKQVEKVYQTLTDSKIEVLYDDRENVSAGKKFADADLIGMPWRLVVSAKTEDKVEAKRRTEDKTSLVSITDCIKILQK